jgi:hypothetical protein
MTTKIEEFTLKQEKHLAVSEQNRRLLKKHENGGDR